MSAVARSARASRPKGCCTRRPPSAPTARRTFAAPSIVSAATAPVAELAELALSLVARGVEAYLALIEVQRRFDLLFRSGRVGADTEEKLPFYVTCAAYDLDSDKWDPLEEWGETTGDDSLADGILTDADEERAATQRSHHLAGYLMRRPTTPVSRAVVAATERILIDHLDTTEQSKCVP